MEPTSQEFVKSDDFTWDDETKDDDLNFDSNVELDREWEARRNNFYTVGYREGLLAGKESSAQAGFNDGFKLSILHGYEWGVVRGLTSAFASLPEQLKNKLLESDVRTRVETLYGKVSSITGIDAQKYFYEDVLSGRVGTKLTNVNEYGQMRPSSGALDSDIQVSGEGRPLRSHVKKHSASSSETRMDGSTSSISENKSSGLERKTNEDQLKAKDAKEAVKSAAEAKTTVDLNMEASMAEDDVERAGGYGATDDIRSFLPGTLDSTDFEAALRDAREYEEGEAEIARPGLGWSEVDDTNGSKK